MNACGVVEIHEKICYRPPVITYTEEEIQTLNAVVTARSGMGYCKHTYHLEQ